MFHEHFLIQQYQETGALCSEVSEVISTVHKYGINTYNSVLSNFNLSSQERGIEDSHKLLRKIWVTQSCLQFSMHSVEVPLIGAKYKEGRKNCTFPWGNETEKMLNVGCLALFEKLSGVGTKVP